MVNSPLNKATRKEVHNMNKSLVVLWESYRDGKPYRVFLTENPHEARSLANYFRTTRQRRADILPLDGEALKRLVS